MHDNSSIPLQQHDIVNTESASHDFIQNHMILISLLNVYHEFLLVPRSLPTIWLTIIVPPFLPLMSPTVLPILCILTFLILIVHNLTQLFVFHFLVHMSQLPLKRLIRLIVGKDL